MRADNGERDRWALEALQTCRQRSAVMGMDMAVKKTLHKLFSPLLYGAGVYQRLWASRSRNRPFTAVLAYHRVVPDNLGTKGRFGIERGIPARVFEAQLRFMRKHFAPVLASQALEGSNAPLRFAVTLDDGYADNFQVAAPILERLGISGTFFVVSEFVGTDRLFWWEQLADMVRKTEILRLDLDATLPDLAGAPGLSPQMRLDSRSRREWCYERLSAALRGGRHEEVPGRMARLSAALGVQPREEGRDYPLMDWRQLRTLADRGHEIGGHTATHPNVVGLDREGLEREIRGADARISDRLSVPVRSFAYPYGHYDRADNRAAAVLAETGCRVAFVGEKGVVQGQAEAFELPRVTLNRPFSFACAFNVQDSLR